MSQIIQVSALSKRFIISHEGKESYTTLRDVVVRKAKKIFSFPASRKIAETKQSTFKEEFWALDDVSFNINEGERIGIIGRNGAGKSTLLKILSRITEPTTGSIKIKGRVASLLEVGTGFHPELTGRENIFLNGAILGMSRAEIKKHFDAIINFAEVEQFLDTPVKRYSSGMYVRLAFAVAAHLEPEILVVDEVLAVGDAEFQKKCFGKMKDVSDNQGRTVLFVSHNMTAIKQLCNKGLLLEKGKLIFSGSQDEAVMKYQSNNQLRRSYFAEDGLERYENEYIKILKFIVSPLNGDVLTISSGFKFELTFLNKLANINLDVTFDLKSIDETTVFHHGAFVTTGNDSRKGKYTICGEIPPDIINAGIYKFKIIFGKDQRYFLYDVVDFVTFEVFNEPFGNNFQLFPGVLRMHIPYSIGFDTDNLSSS